MRQPAAREMQINLTRSRVCTLFNACAAATANAAEKRNRTKRVLVVNRLALNLECAADVERWSYARGSGETDNERVLCDLCRVTRVEHIKNIKSNH